MIDHHARSLVNSGAMRRAAGAFYPVELCGRQVGRDDRPGRAGNSSSGDRRSRVVRPAFRSLGNHLGDQRRTGGQVHDDGTYFGDSGREPGLWALKRPADDAWADSRQDCRRTRQWRRAATNPANASSEWFGRAIVSDLYRELRIRFKTFDGSGVSGAGQ